MWKLFYINILQVLRSDYNVDGDNHNHNIKGNYCYDNYDYEWAQTTASYALLLKHQLVRNKLIFYSCNSSLLQ